MPRRGAGFCRDEVDRLLTSIEEILPIGGTEWDAVLASHELYYPDAGRTRDGLKRKFYQLYGLRIPTGDPHIPPEVLRAKRLYEEIKKRAEISDGEDDDCDICHDNVEEYHDDDDEDPGNDDDIAGNNDEDRGNQESPAVDSTHLTPLPRDGEFGSAAGHPVATIVTMRSSSSLTRSDASTRGGGSITSTLDSTARSNLTNRPPAIGFRSSNRKIAPATRKRKNDQDDEDDASMKAMMLFMLEDRKLELENRRQELAAQLEIRQMEEQARRDDRIAAERARSEDMDL